LDIMRIFWITTQSGGFTRINSFGELAANWWVGEFRQDKVNFLGEVSEGPPTHPMAD